MRNQSLTTDVLADALRDLLSTEHEMIDAVKTIKKNLPSLSDSDAIKVYQLISAMSSTKEVETVEIVTTTPLSFLSKTRKTRPVIEELINSAEKNILLTGYSISEYFDEMLKAINTKSKSGVVVELFVNSYDKARSVLNDIEHTNRRFFKVYEYCGKVEDKMAALHAKTILVDGKRMLISSANLSFHGLDGNIEIGALITSDKKVAQVLRIFSDLKRQKVFALIDK